MQISREFAEQRLGEYIVRGREKSANVVRSLMEETQARKDVVVPRQLMNFQVTPSNVTMRVTNEQFQDPLTFTEWSEDQMLGTLKVPAKFLRGLMADGGTGAEIAEETLNNLRYRIGGEDEQNGKSRRLLRVVRNEVRGWLSPSYGMFDQGELLAGLGSAIAKAGNSGIIFTDGVISDRRYALTTIQPKILEVYPGEFIVIGGQLQSSDYGFGAVDFIQQIIRVICQNGAVGTSFFRRIHRSSGFGGDSEHAFEISERTRQLGSQATVSLLTDAVSAAFSQKAIDKVLDAYRLASAREINPQAEAKTLREKGILGKEDEAKIPSLLQMDLEILPNTQSKASALRFGNLLSWMAGESDGEKQLNLQAAAGKYYLPQ